MDTNKILEMVEMFEQNISVKDIAEELDVSPATVHRHLKEQGYDSSIHVRKVNEDEILKAYQDNARSIASILREYDITYSIFYGILNDHDIPIRKEAQANGKEKALVAAIEMYKRGDPLWMIKQNTGVHQPVLHAELHKRKVPLRRPRK